MRRLGWLLLLVAGCGDDETSLEAVPGTSVVFDLDGDLATAATFYDFPFPSDSRRNPNGGPDYAGVPGGDVDAALTLVPAAEARAGFAAIPVVYFRFDGPLGARDADVVAGAEILLLDVD